MKVSDIIEKNLSTIRVKVQGVNPDDDCDPKVEEYFDGELSEIPDSFRDCEVLRTGWLVGAECNFIAIPYLPKAGELTEEQEKKFEFVRHELLRLLQAIDRDILRAEYMIIDGDEYVEVGWLYHESGQVRNLKVDVTADSLKAIAVDVLRCIG